MANVTTGAPALQPSARFVLLQTIGKVHRARLQHRLHNRPTRAQLCSQWLGQLNRQLKTC